MVIKEDVVAVGAESGILPEECPDLVESRTPSAGNLVDTNIPTDRREDLRGNELDGNVSGHDGLSLRRSGSGEDGALKFLVESG